jgi:hypothetical protein
MLASSDRLLELEAELAGAVTELETTANGYATARQLVGLRDDRFKRELSLLVSEYIRGGEAAGASEHHARADERYKAAATKILNETISAQKVCVRFEIVKIKIEAVQQLLNDERAKMKL